MRIAFVGSRTFCDGTCMVLPDTALCKHDRLAEQRVRELVRESGASVVVSGACPKGVDKWAAEESQRDYGSGHGQLELLEFPADWEAHGKKAGFLRNITIVENCEKVIALWNGTSKGTKHTIDLALKHRKPLVVDFM